METLIIIITVLFIVHFVYKNHNKELLNNQNKNEFTVRLSKIYVWIGVIATILFLSIFILILMYPNGTGGIWVGVVFWAFILFGTAVTNAGLAWKIEVNYKKDFFVYRTFFWRTFEIHYSDIRNINDTQFYLSLKYGEKTFIIDKSAYNFELFSSILEKANRY